MLSALKDDRWQSAIPVGIGILTALCDYPYLIYFADRVDHAMDRLFSSTGEFGAIFAMYLVPGLAYSSLVGMLALFRPRALTRWWYIPIGMVLAYMPIFHLTWAMNAVH